MWACGPSPYCVSGALDNSLLQHPVAFQPQGGGCLPSVPGNNRCVYDSLVVPSMLYDGVFLQNHAVATIRPYQ